MSLELLCKKFKKTLHIKILILSKNNNSKIYNKYISIFEVVVL